MTTVTLRPNATGDRSECTPVGDTPNYKCVDEESSDSDTTYVKSTEDIPFKDLYNLPASGIPVGSTINFVKVYIHCRSENASYPASAYTFIKTGGSEYEGEVNIPPISYQLYSKQYNTNPKTGSLWTTDDVDALQIGVELISNYYITYRNGRCTQVYIEVDYTAPTIVTPTVTTQPTTDITDTTATLNGTIINTGDENCDQRGFEWGYSSGNYPYSWTENGSFGASAFSHGVTGLTRNQMVYCRAKAHNSAGWGYGNEVSFQTLLSYPTVTTQDATDIIRD